MGTKTYDKLVRDRIPEIIAAKGKKAITEILPEDQYIMMLEKKLGEEMAEYMDSKDLEELADLLEVIYALALAKGVSISELEQIRKSKANERGGFDKRILLKEVIES